MKIIPTLILNILLIQSALGQTENEFKYSGGIGFGLGSVKFTNQNSGFSLNTDAQLKHGSSIYEVSYYKWFGFEFFTAPLEYAVSYCLKYGKEFKFVRKGGLFSMTSNSDSFTIYSVQLKAGISFLEIRERTSVKYQRLISDEYNTKSRTGLGLPLEIEVRSEINKFFGLNAQVSGNLNAISPFYDISLGVYFGDL